MLLRNGQEQAAEDASALTTTAVDSLATTISSSTPPRSPLQSLPSLADSIRALRESPRPHDPQTPDPRTRARRKPIPIPSPLHSSQTPSAQTPPSASSTYPQEPRSPREKLDALIAEEEKRAGASNAPAPSPASQPSPPTPTNTAHFPSRGGTQLAKPSSYAQLRNVSAPILSSAGISPPLSPVAMPPPSRPSRPETRPSAPPRNPSIDSAASSLSSSASQPYRGAPGHAYSSSQDVTNAQPPDMAALIAAAGSPEAALLALWKKEQSGAAHNAQLWRLVEKQRSMIIGLQKDLERALKDKDRYRKKLKDYVNQVPPIPGAPKRSDTFDSVVERDQSQSPAPSERLEEPAKASPVPRPDEHKTSPLAQEAMHLFSETQLAHSPSHSSEAHTASNPASSVNSPIDYSVQPLNISNKGLGLNTVVNEGTPTVAAPELPPQLETARKEPEPPRKEPATPPSTARGHLKAPSLSLTQATPEVGGNGFDSLRDKPTQPLRKPPPAPLNLAKPAKTSAHLHQAAPGDHDESDYDDTLEVEEIPILERGRRKTREEDDRVRETIAIQQDEARSKSKKKKSESKSKPKTVSEGVSGNDQGEPVASPRQFSPLQAGLPLSPRHAPPSSLNALLSPTNSDSSMIAQRSVSSPVVMSPGLPNSPRPGDRPIGSPLPRNPRQELASPPMSPRSTVNGGPQPAARTPRQPVPLPPNTPQSYTSPPVARADPSGQAKQTLTTDLLKPPHPQSSPESDTNPQAQNDLSTSEHVYRGLVSDQYPGLLLPPNALPSIEVKVFSSRLRPSRLSFLAPKPQEEDPVFILAIYARSDGKQLWRMEKTIVALPTLDAQLKSLCDFHGKLPDRILFSGHAPAKMDARRAALNQYFDAILETPMTEKAALVVCEFFSTDVIGAQNGDALAPEPSVVPAPTSIATKDSRRKEGYLTKRGKNFGGWKARYFILDGPEFRYYEIVGGAHLGTIKLQNAQIGKQSQQQSSSSPQRPDGSEENQYRHAFLILEPKRKDSSSLVRHVLCAESDEERDAWVDALLQHVEYQEQTSPVEAQSVNSTRSGGNSKGHGHDSSRSKRKDSPEMEKKDRVQGISYDDTIAAEAPMRGPTHREAKEARDAKDSREPHPREVTVRETHTREHTHSPKNSSFPHDYPAVHPSISGPSNGAPIQNVEIWGNKPVAAPTSVKDKKRSIFGFRGRGSSDLQIGGHHQQPERVIQTNRTIFGIPLQEAVEYTQPVGVDYALPAVVYRCLEYLKAKNAINEEGIFRLSGSNILIKGLRERFNNEGDVKLLDGQYYDVHAIASLLKLYLRELPASILTREFHLDFLKVLDMDERSKKIQTFNVLVHRLPRVNYELLRHIASFLIEIVDNAGVNKMTVRNVGIVFAPTLNIPAPLISFFLTDYTDIFGAAIDAANSPIHEIHVSAPPLGDEAVRSPRHQMFSDIPTPAYNETSFQQAGYDRPPSSFPMTSNAPQYPPPHPPQQQQQQQQRTQYAGYDTGFIPMRPSYDTPAYENQYSNSHNSLNEAVKPSSARDQRQRRRESSMLLMNMGMGQGMGQRKGSAGSGGSLPRHREPGRNRLMVQEETAFE